MGLARPANVPRRPMEGGGGQRLCNAPQKLPPRPPSTQEAGSQSAASRKSAEELDPRCCPGARSELQPIARARAPFRVRRPGRSPSRPCMGSSPRPQNETASGQDPAPLTPGKLGCPTPPPGWGGKAAEKGQVCHGDTEDPRVQDTCEVGPSGETPRQL